MKPEDAYIRLLRIRIVITGLYQNTEAFPFPIGHPELSNVIKINPPKWRSQKNVAVPSVDLKCAMTIYAKSRSIIAVMLNDSFIPLATRRTEKTAAAATAETTAASE